MKDKIIEELKELYNDGLELKKVFNKNIQIEYQVWYTKSLRLVKQLAPERYEDFLSQYSNKSIADIYHFFTDTSIDVDMFSNREKTIKKFDIQIGILKSVVESIESVLSNITGLLEAELFDNELDSAKNLVRNGYIRAAGAICGVVLETHFSKILINHSLKQPKRDMQISDYNDLFKQENIYDITNWRFVQYLGDIRNKCDHKKTDDPTQDEINSLINGTEKVIKTIF